MRLKKILIVILVHAFSIVFLISSFILLKDWYSVKEMEKINEQLIQNSIERESDEKEKTLDWSYLKNINSDIIAWIEIEDTKINYPILKDKDIFYLSHTPSKKYNKNGSIFTTTINPFEDKETTVYGHNMKNGTMFSDLEKHWNKDFFYSHLRFKIYTQKCNYMAVIFSIYSISVEKENSNIEFMNFDERVSYYKKNSKYSVDSQNSINKIIKLCTCSYINVEARPTDKRYYIVANLIPF